MQLVSSFDRNRMAGGRAIRQFRDHDPQAFHAAAVEVLRAAPEDLGSRFVLTLLLAQPQGVEVICDPALFSSDESVALIKRAKALDPQIEVKVANLLLDGRVNSENHSRLATRVMEVIDRAASPERTLPALRQLIQSSNPHIRSKAALLIGRISRNPQWAKMVDPLQDQRVIANAVESLWGLKSDAALVAFEEALNDARNRVAGNGAIGLYLGGDFRGVAGIFRLARSQDAATRSTAAWCMGRCADPRFLSKLAQYQEDPDETVRETAKKAKAEIDARVRTLTESGTIPVQIQTAKWNSEQHALHVLVGEGERQIRDLTAFQFVVWNGGQVIEEFTLAEVPQSQPPAHYQLSWPGPEAGSRELTVEVYTEAGCGRDTGHELTF